MIRRCGKSRRRVSQQQHHRFVLRQKPAKPPGIRDTASAKTVPDKITEPSDDPAWIKRANSTISDSAGAPLAFAATASDTHRQPGVPMRRHPDRCGWFLMSRLASENKRLFALGADALFTARFSSSANSLSLSDNESGASKRKRRTTTS